ncbi:MAG TPA: sulfatase [Nevskiaceae bacterium]|nr:sulfatase [Nevskiaceae bacterium]
MRSGLIGLLSLLLGACGGGESGGPPPAASCPAAADARPNFIVLLTDDQERGLDAYMPRLRRDLAGRGVDFLRSYVTLSLCCPSRASLLTGRYAHNTDVLSNTTDRGGYAGFRDSGQEADTVAVKLAAAGYRTAYLGKYLNGYPADDWPAPFVTPPGWGEWMVPVDAFPKSHPYPQYNYDLIDGSTATRRGSAPADYFGDVVGNRLLDYVSRECGPFLVVAGFVTPHNPGTPAPRHANDPVTLPPRHPSFNEADVSDKPRWLQLNPLLTEEQIASYDATQVQRLRSLKALDETVGALIERLDRRGLLERTHLIYTSDNGWHMGEHRLKPNKNTVFEHDIGVPLIWRGPGVAEGRTSQALALNIDIAPTLLDLAGVRDDLETRDGRSLAAVLANPEAPLRSDFLVEHFANVEQNINRINADPFGLEYFAVHTGREVYVEYAYGDEEYYDLSRDPHQLDSQPGALRPEHKAALKARLEQLRTCVGRGCD